MECLRRLEELLQNRFGKTKPKKRFDIDDLKQVSEIISYPPHQDWTFKAWIDQKEEYLKDVCNKAFSGERTLTRDRFLDSFIREMSNETPRYIFVQELNRQPEKNIFENVLRTALNQYSIEKKDLYQLVGAYVLHLAQKEGLVKIKKGIITYSPLN